MCSSPRSPRLRGSCRFSDHARAPSADRRGKIIARHGLHASVSAPNGKCRGRQGRQVPRNRCCAKRRNVRLFFRCGCGRVTGLVSGLGRRRPQKLGSKDTVSLPFLGLRPIARVFACVEFWHCKLHALFLKDLSSSYAFAMERAGKHEFNPATGQQSQSWCWATHVCGDGMRGCTSSCVPFPLASASSKTTAAFLLLAQLGASPASSD